MEPKETRTGAIIIQIKLHSSCEIEYFVETHPLQAVSDTPIARITGCIIYLFFARYYIRTAVRYSVGSIN